MSLIAKVTARGTVWASHSIAYGRLGYKMEACGSTKNDYHLVEPIEVRPADDVKHDGWYILFYGDIVNTERTKRDAQREAEKLLDNPRDEHGWLVQNTGRSYR